MLFDMVAKKMTTLILTALLVAGGAIYLSNQAVTAEIVESVMYFVPADWDKIEPGLTPQDLIEADVMPVGYTSSWDMVVQLAAQGELQALIIHHGAFKQVNHAELEQWVRHDRLVLTGIGIPGDQLAGSINMRGLFVWPEGAGYTDSYYFYTYSYDLTGSPEDTAGFADDDGTLPGKDIKHPLSRSVRSTTDGIGDVDGVWRMVHIVGEHIETMSALPEELP